MAEDLSTVAVQSTDWDLLLFSDVHLGSDLRRSSLQHAGSLEALCRNTSLDTALGALLDHYAEEQNPGRHWRLVLAGDIIDFISINVTPAELGETASFEITEEERQYGLEPGPERCAWMMRLVLRRHPHFFRRLAAFLARGNDIVVVRGNHDAALLWPSVQQTFVTGLLDAAAQLGLEGAALEHLRSAVRFEEWFYFEPGRIYVEHGHLHDAYCSEPNARSVDAQHPDRLSQPVSTLILRYFGNRFSTLDMDNVDQWTAWDFVRWAFVVENPIVVAGAWVKTVLLLLVPFWRRYLRRVRRIRAHHRKVQDAALELAPAEEEEITGEVEIASRVKARVAKGVAEAERFALGLARLVRRAAVVGVFGILQIFYLDRVAAVVGGTAVSLSCLALPASGWCRAAVALCVLGTAIGIERWFAASRRVSIAPKLHAAAEDVSKLIEVPLVVMGHSHKAVDTLLGNGRTRYVNLGSWAGAARASTPTEAGCPHLVLRRNQASFVRARLSELALRPA